MQKHIRNDNRKKINASFVAIIMLLSTITTMAVFIATPVVAEEAITANVWTTDEFGAPKEDFGPGELVYIHGDGFTPGFTINISMTRPDLAVEYANSNLRFMDGEPVADVEGCFDVCRYDLDGITGEYTINADDGTNFASYTFSDSVRTLDLNYPESSGIVESGSMDINLYVDKSSTSGTVYFYYGTNQAGPWNLIGSATYYNDGTKNYPWDTTSVTDGTSYYIRVTDGESGDSEDTDISNNAFTICNDGTITSTTSTLLNDGFESNFNNWVTDWERTTSQKTSGSYSAECDQYDNDLRTNNLNTADAASISISFRYRVDDVDPNDNVYVQYYDGSQYDSIEEIGDDSQETWHTYSDTINNVGGESQYFKSNFRLKIEGTSIDSGEELWIDDVLIEKTVITCEGGCEPASVGDFVWGDTDEDGIQDNDELGIPGVTVELYNDGDSSPLDTTTTATDGSYSFTGLSSGTYEIKFIKPAGYSFTLKDRGDDDALDSDAFSDGYTDVFDLNCGNNIDNIDAGLVPECIDEDGDGWCIQDGDCNDDDATIYPGAPELCDGKNNDCDCNTDEGCCDPSCLIPDDLGDTTDIDVNGNSLQSILTAYDYVDFFDISNIVVDGIGNDQSHIQVWDYEPDMTTIEFYIEFVGHEAGYSNVFGYYTDGDVSTFTPMFQVPGNGGVHDGYPSVVQLTSGSSLSEVLVPTGSAGELGFAVCSDTDSGDGTGTNLTHCTETSMNDDGMDHALVYELCNDTYVICFEDKEQSISDRDYQDVVVIMKVTDCYQNIDFGDAPDPLYSTAGEYPTLLANDGARHIIGGPYLGSIAPDAETDGQPDADALGDDNNGIDDEDGITIPPLEIGKTNYITLKINGATGNAFVDGWIDYNQNGIWEHPAEHIWCYYGNGAYSIPVTVPSGLSTGTTYARFRINSQGHLLPTGLAADGEVEDYKVELVDTTDPTQTIQYGQPNQTTDVWGNMLRIGGNTPIYINSTDVGTGTEYMIIDVWWDNGQISGDTGEQKSCNPNNYAYKVWDTIFVYDKNTSNAATYNGLDTDETFGRISVELTLGESCFHEIDAYCYDRVGNENVVRDDILVDADGPLMQHKVGDPNCTDGVNLFVNTSTEITLTAEDFTPYCENCTADCVDTIFWNITYKGDTTEYSESGDIAIFTFGEECHHIVYYWAVDCLGNIGQVYGPFDFYVDETPPESSISFDP